jgi:GT2 family glycosyltransferase
MVLSVIIVSYNVRFFLEQCLITVHRSLEGIDGEVIVVDNNSEDDSLRMLAEKFPEIKVLKNSKNRGFSAANNQAIKIASGKYLLLLNPDTLVGEDTFRKCIGFMDDHPDAGAAGVMMINGHGDFLPESKRSIPTPLTAFFKITRICYLFPRSGYFNRYYAGNIGAYETASVEVLSGAFMFIRKEALTRTGLLDEDFFMYGEDIDLSYRLTKAGFSNYYFPGTRIIHFKGESTDKFRINTVLNFYNAMLIFVRKHFSIGSRKWYIRMVQLAIFFRAGLSLLKRTPGKIIPPLEKAFAAGPNNESKMMPAKKRISVIVADEERYKILKRLVTEKLPGATVSGRISNNEVRSGNNELLGDISHLKEVNRSHKIREVIFLSGACETSSIIDSMQSVAGENVSLRIASEDMNYIIGSRFTVLFEGK